MPTILQEKLAKAIVENPDANKGELLESVGYAKATVLKAPGRTIAQKGVQEALEVIGFTEDNGKSVVTEIMLDKKVDPGNRLKATDQLFKIHGSYAAEKSINLNLKGEDILESDQDGIFKEFVKQKFSGRRHSEMGTGQQDQDRDGTTV